MVVALLVEDGKTTPVIHAVPEATIGVDRGAAVAVATSAGDLLDQAFITAGERRRALQLQRKLSRAAKGSANRNKTRDALGTVRARWRHDFCVKTAHQLAHNNALVVLEKLPVRNMTRRVKTSCRSGEAGPVRTQRQVSKVGVKPGHPVQGLVSLRVGVKSASRYSGTQVVKVPGAFTSQRCLGLWACGPEIP